ncbi:MAG TPA: ABC transporter substrate-binding protein, partial [Amaricoccus sp.]|uniref:ABC transporter substrate-binding protein n=1 Tax=Amaricoccus sp. TaxID=1872485 RepID=UPI002B644CCA
AFALALALLAAAAQAQPAPEATASFGSERAATRLAVLGTTDVALVAPLFEAFVAAMPEVAVSYEQHGSNDLHALASAACHGETVPADLVVSSAVDLQVKLVNDGCAQPHHSLPTAALPPDANWRDELFGVTEEPAVIVYNRRLVPAAEAPRSRFDLIDLLRPADSRYAGRVATYDIEASGLGYLFAFADSQQATTFGSLIEAFARSGAVATCCSAEIIDAVAEGRYLLAYNVLGSYALDRAAHDRRIAVVAPEDYTLVLSRAALIPKGAANPTAAGLLIDFMLSDPGRAALASTHLLFPFAEDLPDDEASLYRPIPLSPTLLLGLDRQKQASFLARWRAAFSPR